MLFSFQMQIKLGLRHKLCSECQSLRKCTEYLEKKNYVDHVSVFTKLEAITI